MTRILVTGGAGFIGSHTVEALLARGDEVWVLDNFNDFYDPAVKEMNIREVERSPGAAGFQLVRADITSDDETIAQLASAPHCLGTRGNKRRWLCCPSKMRQRNSNPNPVC